jgi:hypothetical protein
MILLTSQAITMSLSSKHEFPGSRLSKPKSYCIKTDFYSMVGTRTCPFIVQRTGLISNGEEKLLPCTIRLMNL